MKRAFSVRPVAEPDIAGLAKLWAAVSGFDGGVPALTAVELTARLQDAARGRGSGWRAAIAGNGAIVGALLADTLAEGRVEAAVVVNPAWRRQGVGKALLAELPADRRLLAVSRASVIGAAELLAQAGFTEHHRAPRMRRAARGITPLDPPSQAAISEDKARDPVRAARTLAAVYSEDEANLGLVRARLAREHTVVLYLTKGGHDQGICLLAASTTAKKAEHDANGRPTVGVIERVGLAKDVRGRGLSLALVRAGERHLAGQGYTHIETVVDGRREAAVNLFTREGFTPVDDDIHWVRRPR